MYEWINSRGLTIKPSVNNGVVNAKPETSHANQVALLAPPPALTWLNPRKTHSNPPFRVQIDDWLTIDCWLGPQHRRFSQSEPKAWKKPKPAVANDVLKQSLNEALTRPWRGPDRQNWTVASVLNNVGELNATAEVLRGPPTRIKKKIKEIIAMAPFEIEKKNKIK